MCTARCRGSGTAASPRRGSPPSRSPTAPWRNPTRTRACSRRMSLRDCPRFLEREGDVILSGQRYEISHIVFTPFLRPLFHGRRHNRTNVLPAMVQFMNMLTCRAVNYPL